MPCAQPSPPLTRGIVSNVSGSITRFRKAHLGTALLYTHDGMIPKQKKKKLFITLGGYTLRREDFLGRTPIQEYTPPKIIEPYLALNANVVDRGAFSVPQSGHKELVPERRTVCAVVQETHARVRALLDRLRRNTHTHTTTNITKQKTK